MPYESTQVGLGRGVCVFIRGDVVAGKRHSQ